jgi:hypothetical protein
MARIARCFVALAATAIVLCAAAGAQSLDRLHVRTMTMTAEPSRLGLGDLFRLVLRVRVDERIARLDNVTLPNLAGFDVLGDERRCVPSGRGTACTETLSLAPTEAGVRSIEPIALDAVDARNGRPSRFRSNGVTVAVAPASPLAAGGQIAGAFGDGLRALVLLALLGAIGAAIALRWRRATAPRNVVQAEPVRSVERPLEDDRRWRTMIERLHARPSQARVEAVRAVLRERIGARPGETFADLTARGLHLEEPSAMEALRLIDRAAFIGDRYLPDAVEDAMPALEAVAGMKRTRESAPN